VRCATHSHWFKSNDTDEQGKIGQSSSKEVYKIYTTRSKYTVVIMTRAPMIFFITTLLEKRQKMQSELLDVLACEIMDSRASCGHKKKPDE